MSEAVHMVEARNERARVEQRARYNLQRAIRRPQLLPDEASKISKVLLAAKDHVFKT